MATTAEKYVLRRVESSEPFNKTDHCAQGELDLVWDPSVAFQLEQFRAKTATYNSACNALWNGLDKGDTDDLMAYMKYEPHHPSHAVRDLLLAHHPLSDSVMLKMLDARDHLDPWHMTQVLIDNSPLSAAIWGTVNDPDVLPDYLYQVLKQFDQGMSTKELLENEVFLRGPEKAQAWNQMLWAMDADTLWVGKVDTLEHALRHDSTNNALRHLYWLQLLNGRLAESATVEADLLAGEKNQEVVELGQMLRTAGGHWIELGQNERAEMRNMAFGQANGAGAVAWGALLALQALDTLPTPVLPPIEKSMRRWRIAQGRETEPIVLAAFPNPASDLVRITFQGVVEAGQLEVFDAHGSVVYQDLLSEQKAFIELPLNGYHEGLYLARIIRNGTVLGETKFAIAR